MYGDCLHLESSCEYTEYVGGQPTSGASAALELRGLI